MHEKGKVTLEKEFFKNWDIEHTLLENYGSGNTVEIKQQDNVPAEKISRMP